MYTFLSEPAEFLYACVLSRGGNSEEDFAKHVQEFKKAVEESAAKNQRLTAVVLMTSGHPVPSAKWRAEVSAMMTTEGFNPDMAVISKNPAMRGVLTAISWTTKKYAIEFKMFSALEEGMLWLEEQRKDSLPLLRNMVAKLEKNRVEKEV